MNKYDRKWLFGLTAWMRRNLWIPRPVIPWVAAYAFLFVLMAIGSVVAFLAIGPQATWDLSKAEVAIIAHLILFDFAVIAIAAYYAPTTISIASLLLMADFGFNMMGNPLGLSVHGSRLVATVAVIQSVEYLLGLGGDDVEEQAPTPSPSHSH